MTNAAAYKEYLAFVQQHQLSIFKSVTRTIDDVFDEEEYTGHYNKQQTRKQGNVFGAGGEVTSVSWDDSKRDTVNFSFTTCPCGNRYRHQYYGRKNEIKDINSFINTNHVVACEAIAEKVEQIEGGDKALSNLITYHNSKKRANGKILRRFSRYGKTSHISEGKPKTPQTDLGDAFLSSSVVVQSPKDFPSQPGIYFVRYFNTGQWHPLYIGRSINLKSRWNGHHRQPEIDLLLKLDIQVEFRYIAETPLLKFTESLEVIEAKMIKEFNPKINKEYKECRQSS